MQTLYRIAAEMPRAQALDREQLPEEHKRNIFQRVTSAKDAQLAFLGGRPGD